MTVNRWVAILSVLALAGTAVADGDAAFGAPGGRITQEQFAAAKRLQRGSVTVISTRTDTVIGTVRAGELPNQIVLTPSGTSAYVLNSFSRTVTRIRVGTVVTATRVRVGGPALGLGLNSDGRTIYIARGFVSHPPGPGTEYVLPVQARSGIPGRPIYIDLSAGSLAGPITVTPNGTRILAAEYGHGVRYQEALLRIRTSDRTQSRVIGFGTGGNTPSAMLVTPDSRTAFVLSPGHNSHDSLLTPIRIATGRVLRSLRLPSPEGPMVMTPNGRFIYIADYYDNTVTIVRTATKSVVKRIPVNFARALAVSPDGRTVYAAGADPSTGQDEVTPITVATNTAGPPVELAQDGTITSLAVTPNGKTLYIADYSNDVVVPMSTATESVGTPIPVGPNPEAVAITRDGSMIYVANSNAVG